MQVLFYRRVLVPAVTVVLVLSLLAPSFVLAAERGLPPPVSGLLFKVSGLFERGKYGKAADVIRSFQKESNGSGIGDHPELFFALGNCYLSMKNYTLAADAYREAARRRADHAPTWLNLANALYNMEDYEEAASCFERAFSLGPKKDPELLYYSGVCRLLSGNAAGAVKVFERLLRDFHASERPEWKQGMARALIASGQGRRAIPLIEEMVQGLRGRERKEWSLVLLYQYLDSGMVRRASGLARRLAQQWPEEERWWKALVNVSIKCDRLEDALMGMMIISYLRPLDASETRLLADLNLQAGIPLKALGAYERLLASGRCGDREQRRVLLKYAVHACRRLGEGERALSLLDKYHEMAERDAGLMLARADLLYMMQRYDEAYDAYVMAAGMKQKRGRARRHGIRLGSEQGRAWLMAGYSAWKSGDVRNARRAFLKAGSFASQKKRAGDMLSYLEQMQGALSKDQIM